MGIIGADLSSLEAIRQIAKTTGELAITTGTGARQAGEKIRGEVDDVSASLSTQFEDTFSQLRTAADRADQQIASAKWTGNARETAVQASTEFRNEITKLDTSTDADLQTFTTALNARTGELADGLSNQYVALMNDAKATFEAFANAVASYGADLQAADQSITYR